MYFTAYWANCPAIKASSQIRLTVKSTQASFEGLNKVAMFGGISCKEHTNSVRKDTWAHQGTTTTFDLLKDTSSTFSMPTLTVTPCKCFTTTWQLFKEDGWLDMVQSLPAVYGMSDTEISVSHVVANFDIRKTLFGKTELKVKASLDTIPTTTKKNF